MPDISWDGADQGVTALWGRNSGYRTVDMDASVQHSTRVRTEEIIRVARARSRRYSSALAVTLSVILTAAMIFGAVEGFGAFLFLGLAAIGVTWIVRPLFAAMFRGHDFDKVARSYDQHRTCLDDTRAAEALHSIEELAIPTGADGLPLPPGDDTNRLHLMRYAAALPADVLATVLKAAPDALTAARQAADTAKVTAYEAHVAAHATTEPREWLRREAELRADLPKGYQS